MPSGTHPHGTASAGTAQNSEKCALPSQQERARCSKDMPRRAQTLPASWGRLPAIVCAPGPTLSWAVQLGRLSWRVDSGAALKTHLGAVEGALPAPGLMWMMLPDRVWSTSASSNWGTDEVHGLIWAAEVCWPADRRRPDSRRPWQSVASGSADDGTPCRWHASRRVREAWAHGLPVCGAVEGVSDKIFATSMTRDDQPLRGSSNSGSAFGGAIKMPKRIGPH